MKKLLKYLKSYRLQASLAPLFKLMEAVFELFIPLLLAHMIDAPSSAMLWQSMIVLLVLAVMSVIVSLTAQYFSAVASAGFAFQLRQALFAKMVDLDASSFEKSGKQAWIHRFIVDIDQVQQGVNLFFRLILRAPIIMLGAIVMATFISLDMALIFMLVVILLSVSAFWIMLQALQPQKSVQAGLEALLTHTQNFLSGIRVIKAYRYQAQEQAQFKQETDNLYDWQCRLAKKTSLTHPFSIVLINLGIVGILGLGGWKVSVGQLSQGQVIALVNYLLAILSEFLKMLLLVPMLVKAMHSGGQIADYLKIQPQTTTMTANQAQTQADEMIYVFKQVSYQYPNASGLALDNLSFTIKKGSSVGIIGGIGSGKTTLGLLLAGLYQASRGEMTFNQPSSKPYSVAMATQMAQLFKGTIESNLRWAKPDATHQEMLEALRLASADDIVDNADDLCKTVDFAGQNYSKGQRQRLALARLFLTQAEVMIFDDVSASVDGITEQNIKMAITMLDNTRIVISQKVSFLAQLDHILVLEQGQLVASGTHHQLLQTSTVYQQICLSQGVRHHV